MHHIYDIDHYILIVFKNIFLLALSIVGAEWGWKQKCLTITLPQDSPVTIQRAVGARLQGNLIKWTSVTLLTVSRSRFGGGFAYRRQLCFVTKCHNTMCDYQIQQESPWNFCKTGKMWYFHPGEVETLGSRHFQCCKVRRLFPLTLSNVYS